MMKIQNAMLSVEFNQQSGTACRIEFLRDNTPVDCYAGGDFSVEVVCKKTADAVMETATATYLGGLSLDNGIRQQYAFSHGNVPAGRFSLDYTMAKVKGE